MPTRREWLSLTGAGLAALAANPSARAEPDPEGQSDMILIPAGPFIMGTAQETAERLAAQYGYHVTWLAGEMPRRELTLDEYMIDRYPVTNAEYAEFCRQQSHRKPPHWHGDAPPARLLNHPVSFVNHADASAYAAWAQKRLPTEAEWEKAARGPDGLTFPWGNDFDPGACRWNADVSTPGPLTAPVDDHPKGASPYGVMDMVGNVAEWCADGPGPASAFIKGGCWRFHEIINLSAAARNHSGSANNISDFYGFRCARDVT